MSKSISPYKNVHPGPITEAAWLRHPRRDCSSLLLHCNSLAILPCLTLGTVVSLLVTSAEMIVSIMMPRNERFVLGHSIFWGATGMPR